MNKLIILCGLAVVSTTFTPEAVKSPSVCETLPLKADIQKADPMVQATNEQAFWDAPVGPASFETSDRAELDLKTIPYIEEEDVFDLGFDTDVYLPAGFDPHKTFFDFDAVVYIENNAAGVLNFDTADYLPEGFNAYASPDDFMNVSYMADEAEPKLGFDTTGYLPAGFDPYEVYEDLDSIVYIEKEEEISLGFNTADYLPRGFDPYSR